MTSVISILGPVFALMVLALMGAGARADSDKVTTSKCWTPGTWLRVRRYPTDSNATYLAMYDCGLTEITEDQDFLKNLPNLQIINLEYNDIEKINPAAFHTVPTITQLLLSSNKLRELPVFDESSCPNLTELILDHNQLTGIDNERNFLACVKLVKLDLGVNYIDFIHPDAFKPLMDLKYLYLDNNKISFIPDKIFASNGKLELLTLIRNRITHLPPAFASNLKRAAPGLSFYIYDNPWHCGCLLELLSDVHRAGVTIYKKGKYDFYTHYEGTRPECRYIGMYHCRRRPLSGLLRKGPLTS